MVSFVHVMRPQRLLVFNVTGASETLQRRYFRRFLRIPSSSPSFSRSGPFYHINGGPGGACFLSPAILSSHSGGEDDYPARSRRRRRSLFSLLSFSSLSFSFSIPIKFGFCFWFCFGLSRDPLTPRGLNPLIHSHTLHDLLGFLFPPCPLDFSTRIIVSATQERPHHCTLLYDYPWPMIWSEHFKF